MSWPGKPSLCAASDRSERDLERKRNLWEDPGNHLPGMRRANAKKPGRKDLGMSTAERGSKRGSERELEGAGQTTQGYTKEPGFYSKCVGQLPVKF